jgi:hypothetical protein
MTTPNTRMHPTAASADARRPRVMRSRWADNATRGLESKIFETQAGVLGNPGEHSAAKFIVIVKGKHEIRPALSRQRSVRAGLAFQSPPNSEEGGEHTTSFRGRPGAHAARKETFRNSAGASA